MPNYAKLCSQTICQTSLSTFIVNYALNLFIKIMPYLCKNYAYTYVQTLCPYAFICPLLFYEFFSIYYNLVFPKRSGNIYVPLL